MAPLKATDAAFHDASNTSPRVSHSFRDGGVFSVYASTTIAAPPSAVQAAILDIQRWPEWNTFVPSVQITSHPHPHTSHLQMMEGVNMTFTVQMVLGEPTTTSKETCTQVSRLRTLKNHGPPAVSTIRWNLHNAAVFAPGFVIKAERTSELEEAEDGTTIYRTWETFGGWVAKTIKKKYEGALKERFADWCRDLKKFVEAERAKGTADQSAAGAKEEVGKEAIVPEIKTPAVAGAGGEVDKEQEDYRVDGKKPPFE